MSDKFNNPDYEHPCYEPMEERWEKTLDFWNGVDAVREKDYLVKFSREDQDDYAKRKKAAELFNVFAGTVAAVVGMVFKTKIVPEDEAIPEPIKRLFPDIDDCGNDLSTFLRQTFTNEVRDGHSFILVDNPEAVPVGEGETATGETVKNQRPFWINYRADQIINWDFERRGSKHVLTRVFLKETVIEKAGEYGKRSVVQIRELTETEWRIWRKKKNEQNEEVWSYDERKGTRGVRDENGNNIITLIPVYGSRKTGEFESIPPYYDLLDANIGHYNKQSKLDTALDYVVPMVVFRVGVFEDVAKFQTVVASPNRSIIGWGENFEASYLELKGESISELKSDIATRETRMSKMGIEKFAPVADLAAKTAFEVGSDNRRSMSEVGIMAQNLEDAVELAFYYTALCYNSIMKGTVKIGDWKARLQLDYDKLTFSVDQIRLFKELADSGYLSKQTLLEMLPTIAEMPENFDIKEELKRIQNEGQTTKPQQINQ